MGSKEPQLPLSKRESDILRTSTSTHRSAGSKCIYQVRACRDDDGHWRYEGKSYNHNYAEPLTPQWLSYHNMTKQWRNKTICKHQCYWYRVRVYSTPDEQRPGCIPLAIIKFYNHVGMYNRARELHRRWTNGMTIWGDCIKFIYDLKGFTIKKPNCQHVTDNLLVLGKEKCLFVIQISAFNKKINSFDNLHAICVFNGLIFDANHEHPLRLTEDNLNECCLGGTDWIFHHASRVRQFTPAKKTTKAFAVFRY